jgi:hypothetical protein
MTTFLPVLFFILILCASVLYVAHHFLRLKRIASQTRYTKTLYAFYFLGAILMWTPTLVSGITLINGKENLLTSQYKQPFLIICIIVIVSTVVLYVLDRRATNGIKD